MVCYLQIENLTKSFSDRILFQEVNFGVNQGDKIGIIAKNGTGKSTLLQIIAGKEPADSGSIVARRNLRIATVEQSPDLPDNLSVLDACLNTDSEKSRIVCDYEKAVASTNGEAIAEIAHRMDALSAWDYDDLLRQMLHRLGITDLSAKVESLSGGQKKRVAIACALLSEPDMIILDEPTNHLDIDAIEWLEEYLQRQNVTLILVTHDRYFLDRVCSKIIEIDNQRIYTYEGNYDYYLRRRAERLEAMASELAKVKNTLRRETEWMRRQPQARAGKAKYRIDAYHDLRERSEVDLRTRDIDIKGMDSTYIGSKIFVAHGVSKRYGDKVILDNFNYTFARYERLGIIGHNGVGKSTLIKMLQGLVAPDSGHWEIGETVKFGYYSQDGMHLDENMKVIDAVTRLSDDIVLSDKERSYTPQQFLQRFLFSPPDQQKRISSLSGGEKCRLHLALTLMSRPNFLILDEPTNDLDIMTLAILEDYLRNFKGCLIVVSHDRFFLDSIVDHLWVMEGSGTIRDFPGTYSEYRTFAQSKPAKDDPEKRQKKNDVRQTQTTCNTERARRLTFKERKEYETLEQEISQLETEKQSLEEAFNSGQQLTDITEMAARYETVRQLLDEKELRWLELDEFA